MSVKLIGSLMSAALLTALALGVFALFSHKLNPDAGTEPASQGNPHRPQAELLPVMLRAGGFVPREISRPAGDYVLSVNDQSRLPVLNLRLSRENGERMHEAKVSRHKPYWRQLLRLTPGTYVITEANHPGWECRITVTAH